MSFTKFIFCFLKKKDKQIFLIRNIEGITFKMFQESLMKFIGALKPQVVNIFALKSVVLIFKSNRT